MNTNNRRAQTDISEGNRRQSPVYTGESVSQARENASKKGAAVVRMQNVGITVTPIRVETESRQIMGRNDNRRYLALQNQSGADVYINFGRPATVGESSFLLSAGGTLLMESGVVPNSEVHAIGTASLVLTVVEGSGV